MIDLLTVRQVQDILQVDRITVYRMLQDGRLRGSKIGQQWRFTRQEVERLIHSETPVAAAVISETDSTLPIHCIQTVQDLFSNVSRLGAVVVTLDGRPITQMSSPDALSSLVLSTPSGQEAYRACWAAEGQSGKAFTCPAGLRYLAAPVLDGENAILTFLVGGFYFGQPDPVEQGQALARLAEMTSLPLEDLRRAASSVPVVDESRRAEVEGWPLQAVNAVHSILKERTHFMERLQKIANLTQLS